MSTDTAFALGMLALVGPQLARPAARVPAHGRRRRRRRRARRHRDRLHRAGRLGPLLVAVALFAVVLVRPRGRLRRRPRLRGARGGGLGRAVQVRHRPGRRRARDGSADLRLPRRRASTSSARPTVFRLFREQPTPELARTRGRGSGSAISPNERLQQLYHPWTSYVFVPLFALANAGIAINGGFLSRAFTSPITLGILVGYVVGKPVGIIGTSLARDAPEPRPPAAARRLGAPSPAAARSRASASPSRCCRRRSRSTASSSRRRSSACSPQRSCASVATWLVFRGDRAAADAASHPGPARHRRVDRRPRRSRRPRARPHPRAGGRAGHARRVRRLRVPVLRKAEPVVRELLADFGDDVRYVWRHLPLNDVHPHAQLAAEAAEAAARRAPSGRCTTCCSTTRTRSGRRI